MKLPQVSTATATATAMLASMAQRAMAQEEGPPATPEYDASNHPNVIAGYVIGYTIIGIPMLIFSCCFCCGIIERCCGLGRNDRRRDHVLTGVVLEGQSTNQGLDPAPSALPIQTGVVVSPNFYLATQPSAQSVTSVPVSPAVGLAGQPSAPPATGIPVSADLVLANPQSIPIGQLSPSPAALALSSYPSPDVIQLSSAPV